MKVLVVDNYDSFTFNLTAILRRIGAAFDMLKNDRLDIELAEKYEKILISPGPGIPSESGMLCEMLKELSPRKSILGICLGHQAIAEVFGARLERLSSPEHGNTRRIRITDFTERIFDGLPVEFNVGLYHSWTVCRESMPGSLRITAETPDGAIMALKHCDYDIRGVQFHPESIMTKYGYNIIKKWLSA